MDIRQGSLVTVNELQGIDALGRVDSIRITYVDGKPADALVFVYLLLQGYTALYAPEHLTPRAWTERDLIAAQELLAA